MISLYKLIAGPLRVPSFEISVQRTFLTPNLMYFSKKGIKSSDEFSCHPLIDTLPLLTSAPKMILSAPYWFIHLISLSGLEIATLPMVTIDAPLSKAFSISVSVFIPPPKSTINEVFSVMLLNTSILTTCFDLAPSRSTT